MNLYSIDNAVANFTEAISLTTTQAKRIDGAMNRILGIFFSEYNDATGAAQGSAATDTLVKPLTAEQSNNKPGEYDVDIAVRRDEWSSAVESLEEAEGLISDHYRADKIDGTKNRCVRVYYADENTTGVGFHVDIVLTRENSGEEVADRPSDDWIDSNTQLFAANFNEKADEDPNIRPITIVIKRLRDLGGFTDNLKSIAVASLVLQHYQPQGLLLSDLQYVLDGIATTFSGDKPAAIPNPVQESEHLEANITDYFNIRSYFIELSQSLNAAVENNDADKLRQIFGAGFQYESSEANARPKPPAVKLASKPARSYADTHQCES